MGSASAADHAAIQRLLLNVFHAPTPTEFHAQVEHPGYDPAQRLLARRGEQIVAHLKMTPRQLHFGPLDLSACMLSDVATLPEYRRQGYASGLLDEAERRLKQQDIRLAVLRTSTPEFYKRRGWVVCFRHSDSTARPRDLLAQLSALESDRNESREVSLYPTERPALRIRLWRHVEQAALMRLYDQFACQAFGPPRRDEEYWRWLISRRGYDRIFVALDGPDKSSLEEGCDAIRGYATMREGRIVELITDGQRSDVAAALLQRACADAIEQDQHEIRLDAPPDHPLRDIFQDAGGTLRYHEARQGEVFMVRLFKPLAFLARLGPLMLERARQAELPLPSELGLLLDDQKYRLVLTRRSAKVLPGKLGRSYLSCSTADLVPVLLGHVDVSEAAAAGRLSFSTAVAQETARVLLPPLPLWLPPWDDLASCE